MLIDKRKAIAFMIACALLPAIFAGCAAPARTAIAVTTAAAQIRPLNSEVSLFGVLIPNRTVSVTSKLSGQAMAVNAEVGNNVKKGDTLIIIETKQLSAQLTQAQAALKQARSALKSAKSTYSSASNASKAAQGAANTAKINYEAAVTAYNSTKALYDSGLATQSDLNKAKAAMDVAKSQYNTAKGPAVNQAKSSASAAANNVHTAEAAVEVAEANVNIILVQMENASVLSPVDGVVINRNINAGEIVPVTAPVFSIAEVDTLKLKGTVSQKMLPFISEGQNIEVAVDIYPGRTFAGTVSLIGPMAVSTGEYFPIEITVPNDAGLKPGLTARAAIKVEVRQNPLVPVSAVQKEGEKSFVYVIKNGRAAKREVTTGLYNTNYIEILSGLAEGEIVAAANVNLLSENIPVTVQDETAQQ